jgi:urea transporter/murein DD-endopeptidase MepM/ murein hydrolase activator NlpD
MTAAASPLARFADSVCYSYAQILFANRRWFGLVLLAVTFLHPVSGALALLAVVLSNLLAYGLKFDPLKIQSGFYGFTGILLGAAYGFYFEMTPFLLAIFPIFVVLSFFIAAALEHYLAAAFNLPGLSLPFMLALYITLVFLRNYSAVPLVFHPLEALPAMPGLPEFIQQYLHALALILFQPHALGGAILALALLVFSRVFFVLSLAGFSAAYFTVQWLLPEQQSSLTILCGLNAILISLSLGGALVIPSRKSLALAVLAVVMTVVFTGFFQRVFASTNLPVMVLPFNLVALGTIYSLKFRQKTSGLVLLYFLPGSPEENYEYHHTTQARINGMLGTAADLPFSGEWTVSQGHSGPSTHKDDWRYAWDFIVVDDAGRSYSGNVKRLEDYYCYGLPVTAPLSGEVVRLVDGVPDNLIGEINLRQNWGNTLVLKHGEGFFSALSHLQPGSMRVEVGTRVERGQILACCGNSGRSPEPHLHFQFQATEAPGAATIYVPFGAYTAVKDGVATLFATACPEKDQVVQNLPAEERLLGALSFPLHQSFDFEIRLPGGTTRRERWTSNVDMYNIQYLESSAGAWANFYSNGKLFYLTDFRGNRDSALYYFYLSALQIPLGVQADLHWTDRVPLSKINRSLIKPVSDLLLLFARQMEGRVEYRLSEPEGGSVEIRGATTVQGKGLFRFYRRNFRSVLRISSEGQLSGITYERGGRPPCIVHPVTYPD